MKDIYIKACVKNSIPACTRRLVTVCKVHLHAQINPNLPFSLRKTVAAISLSQGTPRFTRFILRVASILADGRVDDTALPYGIERDANIDIAARPANLAELAGRLQFEAKCALAGGDALFRVDCFLVPDGKCGVERG